MVNLSKQKQKTWRVYILHVNTKMYKGGKASFSNSTYNVQWQTDVCYHQCQNFLLINSVSLLVCGVLVTALLYSEIH